MRTPADLIVAYTDLRPETAAVAGPFATYVDTSDDDEAYWRLLDRLWSARRTFVLLEHDIVPDRETLQTILNCPHDWCGVPYPVGNLWGVFHGCTRYSAALIRRNPGAVRAMRDHTWRALDSQLIAYLAHREGSGAIWHWPGAEHLNRTSVPAGHVFANCGDCGGPLRWDDLRVGPDRNTCPRCGRMPSYFHPTPQPILKRRTAFAMQLKYVGSGGYLNGVPARDFATDDAGQIAECLESGLYVEVRPPRRVAKDTAPEPDVPAAAPEPDVPAVPSAR